MSEIKAARITAARVCLIPDGSEDVLIRLSSVLGEINYVLELSEFQRLAEQFSSDAKLLATKEGSAGAN